MTHSMSASWCERKNVEFSHTITITVEANLTFLGASDYEGLSSLA